MSALPSMDLTAEQTSDVLLEEALIKLAEFAKHTATHLKGDEDQRRAAVAFAECQVIKQLRRDPIVERLEAARMQRARGAA